MMDDHMRYIEAIRKTPRWTQSHMHDVGSKEWCQQVDGKLLDGYGVEDIALWVNCHASRVRAYVTALRKHGKLAIWWPTCV
jgi:hypothetical protein